MAKKTRKAYRRRSTDEQIKDLEAQLVELRAQSREEKRFTPDAVRADRKRLELSRADYAFLVDVSALTIYHWERGQSKPRVAPLNRWLKVRELSVEQAWKTLGYE